MIICRFAVAFSKNDSSIMTSKLLALFIAFVLVFFVNFARADNHNKIDYQRVIWDKQIENRFEQGLEWQDKRFANARVQLHVFNGYVLIYGEVPEQELKDIAEHHANNIDHVRRVFNQLTIGEIQDHSAFDELIVSASIKGYLLGSNIDASLIWYQVDGTTAYLMGLVNDKESAIAISQVKKVKEITKIVTAFEFVQ